MIDPIQSRQTFGITPPSKKEVAVRLKDILDTEGVKYEMSDLAAGNSGYPDIRRALNAGQRQVIKGELKIDKTSTIQINHMDEVLTLLKSDGNVKDILHQLEKLSQIPK